MTQAALVGYFVGGAFRSLAYFDVPYDLVVVVVRLCAELESIVRRPATPALRLEAHGPDRLTMD